jgi:hypothetical protein
MSNHSFSPPASVGAWSLAILVVAVLAAWPRPTASPAEGSGTIEPVSGAVASPSRGEATNHDPSVPAASSVTFPVGDGSEPAIATF